MVILLLLTFLNLVLSSNLSFLHRHKYQPPSIFSRNLKCSLSVRGGGFEDEIINIRKHAVSDFEKKLAELYKESSDKESSESEVESETNEESCADETEIEEEEEEEEEEEDENSDEKEEEEEEVEEAGTNEISGDETESEAEVKEENDDSESSEAESSSESESSSDPPTDSEPSSEPSSEAIAKTLDDSKISKRMSRTELLFNIVGLLIAIYGIINSLLTLWNGRD